MSPIISATVSNKADLTISVDGDTIVITDKDGKKGGNVSSKSRKKIRFLNSTTADCRLVFKRLLPDDVDGADPEAWPFSDPTEPVAPAKKELVIAASDNRTCTLKDVALSEEYKYDVHVELTGVGPLDPIIIVKPSSL